MSQSENLPCSPSSPTPASWSSLPPDWQRQATEPRLTRYIPHTPTPRQQAFLSPVVTGYREVLYGGAAGGGKSDAVLMAALQYVDVPGYAALILRRTYADLSLPGAIMDRAHEWLRGTDAHWNELKKTYIFPSGATLTFGYLDTENAKYRYQGSELQLVAFDELTQFTESAYRYLFSRLRAPRGVHVPIRMRGASNPGGVGHEWVRRRFIDEGQSAGRLFIPARLTDNPHLDQRAYAASLAELDPLTRQQLLAGDWEARGQGTLFKREWFGIVDAAPADLWSLRYWDLAGTEARPGTDPDYTAGLHLGVTARGTFYVLDVQRVQRTPRVVEQLVRQTAQLDGRAVGVRMEQEPGQSGKSQIDYYTREVLAGWAFYGVRSTGPKEARAAPVSSQAEAGNIKLVRGAWNSALLDELEAFPTAGVHDDQVDALSGAFAELTAGADPGQPMAG